VFFQRKYNLAFSKLLTKAAGRYFTRRIRKEKPDVIVAVASTPFTAYLKTALPVILVDDANFSQLIDYYPNYSNLSKASFAGGHQLTRRAFQKASGIVFSSEWSRQSTIKEYQINPDKISVIPYGANLDTVPERQVVLEENNGDEWNLLFLGVDWHRKGGAVAFEALKILTAKGFNVKLTVCGTTPPEQYRHEKMEVISFLDKNNQEDFGRLYQLFLSTKFLVVPTKADCTPIVFGEANAFGIPVLTNDTGGVASVIEQGVNGVLHNPQDTGIQYAQTIESYIRDPRAYKSLVENSRNTYEKSLNWASWGEAIYNLVNHLVTDQQKGAGNNREKNRIHPGNIQNK
jgi:glycosyltransferase involved in cell wall biosynthesis